MTEERNFLVMEESMFVLEKEMFLPVQCESALEQSDFLVEDSGLQEAVLMSGKNRKKIGLQSYQTL